MAGRPAGYSDEENSDDYECYNDDNWANPEGEYSTSAGIESTKDPWATLVLDSYNNPNLSENDYDVTSISSFQKCLEEGNIQVLKSLWFNTTNTTLQC